MILVLIDAPPDFESRIRAIAPDAEISYAADESDALQRARVLVGLPPPDDLEPAARLEWLQLSSAGADRYVDKVPQHVVLTSATGVYGVPVAEHVLSLMLALARGIPRALRNSDAKIWDRSEPVLDLAGKTCGILGMGDIGTEVAKRARAFGMQVIALRRTPGISSELVNRIFGPHEVRELFSVSDHIVNTLPSTSRTKHFVNDDLLRRAKKGAFFYNVGRGATVDEAALIRALESGRLAGAGLDVFETEPLPAESPLWHLENVIVTPHVAGNSPGEGARVADLFLENFSRFVDGRPLLNVVDRELGY